MFISRLKSIQQKITGNPGPQPQFVAWTNQMRVEVKLLDNDHKKLLILLNELHDCAASRYAKPILEMILESLLGSLRAHFVHEERIFTETAYPSAAVQECENELMIERLKVLQARFRKCTDWESSLQVVQLLKDCIFEHLQSPGHAYLTQLKSEDMDAILAATEAPTQDALNKPAAGPRILQGAW